VKRILITSVALLVAASSCNEPEGSGTHTNWLHACASSSDCGGDVICRCGLCTSECTDDSDCESGVCGSALASIGQCGTDQGRICLPEPVPGAGGACTDLPIPSGGTLATPPAPTCVPGALLCESFDAPLPAGDSVCYSGSTTGSIEDCLVHQGAGAIRFQTDTTGGYGQAFMRLSTPVAAGPLYARFYAYVPSSVTVPSWFLMLELWNQDASSDGKISVEVITNDAFEISLAPNNSNHPAAANSLVRDQWMCIELALDVAATGGTASLSVNGTTVINQTGVVTLPPNPISVVVVESMTSTATPVDLAIDDLVVATQPIGCQ
jgi:hypothetical protein